MSSESGKKEDMNTGLNHKTEEQIGEERREIEEAKAHPARFGILYNRYYKAIFCFIYRRVDDEDITADITSDVFLTALMNLYRYRFQGVPFSAWLYRIALNQVNQHFRKTSRRRTVSLEENDVRNMMTDMEEKPDLDREQRVISSLQFLEPDEVEVISLRFFEKKSFKETGDILGITENNAKVRTYRILDKLKKLINGQKDSII